MAAVAEAEEQMLLTLAWGARSLTTSLSGPTLYLTYANGSSTQPATRCCCVTVML